MSSNRELTLKILGRCGSPMVRRLFRFHRFPVNRKLDLLARFGMRTYWTEQELIFFNDNLGSDIIGHDFRVASAVGVNRAMGRTFWHLHWRMEFERDERTKGLDFGSIVRQP